MENWEGTFALTQLACDQISDRVGAFCKGLKLERKEILRYRLSVEEALLYWLEHGCEGKQVEVKLGTRMWAPFLLLSVEGEPMDPYRGETEDFGTYCGTVLANLHLAPEYAYSDGWNVLLYRIPRKSLGQIPLLGLVIAGAALVGVLGQAFLPEGVRQTLQNGVVIPIYNTFFNILGCVAGPMIFLAVTWGIYGIGDAATLSRVGKRLMLRYIGMVFLAAACAAVCFPLFGCTMSQSVSQGSQFASIAELILSIFPSTIVEPFATGNTLQIIFLSVVIGIALLFLGQKTRAVALAIEQINTLVQFLMGIISRLVPFVIFLVVLNLIWSGNLAILGSVWQVLVVFLVVAVVAAAAFLLSVALCYKVSPRLLLRKSMGTFLIALATASSAAAFASNLDTCQKSFGISNSLCSFGIPLGMVIHRPIAAIYNLLLVFTFAAYYEVPCSPVWIGLAVLVSGILAIATPPIPGGGAVAYTILFAQMGIPSEAMAVALTVDILTDFAITAFEVFSLQFSLIHSACRLNMIDLDVLRS